MLRFILLKFTQNSVPLYATKVFDVAVSSDMKRTEAKWYLNQAKTKCSHSTHSSSVLAILCHPFWLTKTSVGHWSMAEVPHPIHWKRYSTKFRNVHFIHPNNNRTYQWRHKHKLPSIILEGSPGLTSIINCRGIYGCFAVPNPMKISWLHL